MKKTTNYLKLLGFFCLMTNAISVYSQGCTFTINASPYTFGSYGFWASSTTSLAGNCTYDWDFGNGNTSTFTGLYQNSAYNTYTANGTYTVTFTYSNSATSCTFTSSQVIVVNTASCTLIASSTYSSALNSFTFASTSTGTTPTTTFNWNFGDGNTASGATVVHTYSVGGYFTPTLTVGEPSSPACDANSYVYISVCTQTASISSTSYSNGLVSFTCTSVLSNTYTYYNWNFGDGSMNWGASTVSHNYLADNAYNVNVQIIASTCTLSVPYSHTVSNVPAASM